MQARIAQHRARRPRHWLSDEAPLFLTEAINQHWSVAQPPVIVVDCLTLWLSNWLLRDDEAGFQKGGLSS